MRRGFIGAQVLALLLGTAGAAPQRIVSLGGGVTETVFALGLGANVVAVDVSSTWPAAALALPKVGYVRQTSAEGIAALKPDLVIAPETLGPPAVVEQLAAAGVRLERVPEARSVDDAVANVRRVGAILGRVAEAEALAKAMSAAAEKAVTRRGPSAPAVLFLFSHGGGSPQVAGEGTAAAAMIAAAGGRNAVSGYQGYRAVSAEAAIAAQPAVVLTTTQVLKALGGEAALWQIPGLVLTPAGQARRLVVMDDLALLGFGPRAGESVAKLTEALHHP